MRRLVPKNQPPQRDPIFRDAKVLLFWCDQQQKEHWLDIPFCCHIGWVFTRAYNRSQLLISPLHQIQYGALYLLEVNVSAGQWYERSQQQ